MDPNSMRMEVVGDPNWGRDPPVQKESQKREMDIAKKQSARWCRWMFAYHLRSPMGDHGSLTDVRSRFHRQKKNKQNKSATGGAR